MSGQGRMGSTQICESSVDGLKKSSNNRFEMLHLLDEHELEKEVVSIGGKEQRLSPLNDDTVMYKMPESLTGSSSMMNQLIPSSAEGALKVNDHMPLMASHKRNQAILSSKGIEGGVCEGGIQYIDLSSDEVSGSADPIRLEAAKGGYRGFYSKITIPLTPKVVNDIHKCGGTYYRTSRGGHDTNKIVDCIQYLGINQIYIIGGDGTQKGAFAIYEEVEKRGLQVAVAGIPKTIDNDIALDCRS